MPSFRLPIAHRAYDPDPAGPIRSALRTTVALNVQSMTGMWLAMPDCVLDSGATYTMASATWARTYHIPIPEEKSTLTLRTASLTGTKSVHDGELRIRFPQLPDRVFRLYCLFVEDYPVRAPLLLGLNDFFHTFRVTIDGRSSPVGAAGHMLFETD